MDEHYIFDLWWGSHSIQVDGSIGEINPGTGVMAGMRSHLGKNVENKIRDIRLDLRDNDLLRL